MRSTMTTGVLEPLSQSNVGLANATEDIRGRKVHDRDGQEFGKVDDVFVDPYERYARFISVKSGDVLGLGGERRLVPIEAVMIDGDRVVINATSSQIVDGPKLNDRDVEAMASTAQTASGAAPIILESYEFYAVQDPFWSPSYQRPNWS
jgi:sporulation protein YlmC with PRC-barrel domain